MMTHEHYLRRLPQLCLKSGGAGLPRNQSDRDVLLVSILAILPQDRQLTHIELDEALESWLETVGAAVETDHVALRRALVDYGFLCRPADGTSYQVVAKLPVDVEPAIWGEAPQTLVRAARAEQDARRILYTQEESS